ncbi:MAG: hypothetical protein AAF573_17840 [Bacteroidota bacterium]
MKNSIKDIVIVKKYDFEQIKRDFEEMDREFILPHNTDELKKIGTIYLALHHPK